MLYVSDDIRQEFRVLIEKAYRVSEDVGQEVEKVLQDGRERPLDRDEAFRLLTNVVAALRTSAIRRGDQSACKALEGEVNEVVGRIMQARDQAISSGNGAPSKRLGLMTYNGIEPKPVRPTPFFHGRQIPMVGGFVKIADLDLWEGNERLEVHLGQFRHKYGRDPDPDELLQIMLSEMPLPGITESDQFEIVALARSVVVNGVRVPPIIDIDGTLLDGNRRVAACFYILNSNEFKPERKRQVDYLFVWQLTEHATDDDRNAVVVSLNFEPDHKQKWPEYVKARKVYNEWRAMLAVEPRRPGPERERALKRELSQKFALGSDTTVVNRYLRMVDWATEFEDYQINQKARDTYEVKHRASEYFQYFDELSKGANPGGVAYTLEHDPTFKHLVFDLLFQGKFKNWSLIRNLKYYDQSVRDTLAQARDETDVEHAQDVVENVLTDAKNRRRESRVVGANERIKTFVNWLEGLPLSAFRDDIRPENLQLLLDALKLVELMSNYRGLVPSVRLQDLRDALKLVEQ